MVALGKDLAVTWVIDPDLLASVDAMTEELPGPTAAAPPSPARTRPSPSSGSAELETAVQGKEVVALPFADPDLASLAHSGKNVTGSLSHLQAATDVADDTVETDPPRGAEHGLRLARRTARSTRRSSRSPPPRAPTR